MNVVNIKEFPKPPIVAHIDRTRCDGCALCIESCPTNALRIVANKSRPGKRIVSITPKLCEGCGVCQGTCPKEAIYIPGLSAQELRGYIKRAIENEADT